MEQKEESLIPRKFNIGELIITKGKTVARVIGSAIYGIVDGKPMRFAWVEYRLLAPNKKRSFYRHENQLIKLGEN